jgi:signal transduction histidine kinase
MINTDSKLISFIVHYGFAVILIAAALAISTLFWAAIKPIASPPFLLAVTVIAWYSGLRAGIFATFFSGILIDYYFIPPEYQISGNFEDISRLVFFTLEGSILCWLVVSKTEAAEEIKKSHEHLRALSIHQQTLVEDERKRIALEIHDELGQILTGLKMEIHFLHKQLVQPQDADKKAQLSDKLKELLNSIDTAIATVRRISTDLRPPILDDLGLVAAIEWQALEFQRRTRIPCAVSTNLENVKLSPEITTAFFRIFQETLTNIARHADAKNVIVKLEKQNEKLTLRVEDDGKGLKDKDLQENGSLGILGMQERARLIDGELRVFNGARRGTVVEVTATI